MFNISTSNLPLFLTKKNINLLSLFKNYLNKGNKYIKYKVKNKSILNFLKFNKKKFFIPKNINWSTFLKLNFFSKKISKFNYTNNTQLLVPKYYISDYGANILKNYNLIFNLFNIKCFLGGGKKANIRGIDYNFFLKK